ncbi:MutS-related protein [Acidithiobacillus sp. M4-SHS-6]|uniref:MutS-related protein n=1 Tax=Acidithiobacillus sp. M4-SHS-6 TaxID=3383024 RepID=UPI0039BE846C
MRSNIDLLNILLSQLTSLRDLGENYPAVQSAGLIKFFRFLRRDYDDETLRSLRAQNAILRMDNGFSVSAKLDQNNRSKDFFLNRNQPSTHWLKTWFSLASSDEGFSFSISQRDESGLTALAEFRDAALGPVARVMDSAVQDILEFFTRLRDESAFYRGALNLREALAARECSCCWPVPMTSQQPGCIASKIYDPCLALSQAAKVITNDLQASNKSLIIITGANSGGKSTFLRALGVNQLLLQSGLLVAAQEFTASLCDEVYTHFKLEEDARMQSGKFDEELLRMADMVPQLKATAMVLFNESFAATNEREGSEIAWQICSALLEKGIKIIFVTHLYTFAQRCYAQKSADILALRAPSEEDLSRKFKISEAMPLSTSFAKDVYNRIFKYK